MMGINDEKAAAIMGFVDMMIGAFESGFTDTNTLNLAQLHRIAENYCKDTYFCSYDTIDERWGADTAKNCGLDLDKN